MMTEKTVSYTSDKMTREWFALEILSGLLAKHGSPCRTEVYLPDLRDAEDHESDEDMRRFREEKKAFQQRVEAYNRRAICRQAVRLADELILQLHGGNEL